MSTSEVVYSYASIRDSIIATETLPIPVFEFLQFLAIAYDFRLAGATIGTRPLIPLYIGYWIACVGGGLTVGLLCGQPPSWLCSDVSVLLGLLAFILIHALPGDAIFKLMTKFPVLTTCVRVGQDISRALSISLGGVDRSRNSQHSALVRLSHTAPLLCGIIAGVGGGILANTFDLSAAFWQFRMPPVLVTPTRPIIATALGTAWYHFATVLASPQADTIRFKLSILPASWLAAVGIVLTKPDGSVAAGGLNDVKLVLWCSQVLLVTGWNVWDAMRARVTPSKPAPAVAAAATGTVRPRSDSDSSSAPASESETSTASPVKSKDE